MTISAKIICDSISSISNQRITTFELEYPRFLIPEINTHRCIIGDTKLYFDLPTAKNKSKTRAHHLTVKEFYDKWSYGGTLRHRLEQMNIRCLDEKTNKLSHTTITDIWEVGIKKTYKLTAGKLYITATDDHLILTDSGWKELKDIQVNVDSIISLSKGNQIIGKPILVSSIEYAGEQTVYDLSVASEQHNFVANGIVIHNCLSRNTASSRAIPIDVKCEQLLTNGAYPVYWGKNQSGMQAKEEIDEKNKQSALETWDSAKLLMIEHAKRLQSLGVHKQITNRLLEPFETVKTLVTATSFDNFFNLRCHADAQPEIKALADMMYAEYKKSKPMVIHYGEWHTPYVQRIRDNLTDTLHYYVDGVEVDKETAIKISCSCSAQVSYRKNDVTIEKVLIVKRNGNVFLSGNSSAFEHNATPIVIEKSLQGVTHFDINDVPYSGNFANWVQYRHLIPENTCYNYVPHEQ